jgi:hypothetical protein
VCGVFYLVVRFLIKQQCEHAGECGYIQRQHG